MATFWGFAVFMPVGVNYAAAVFLLLAMLAGGNLRQRGTRMRHHFLWWPIVAYVAWTMVVLVIGAHYPQTPGEVFHGLRIAVTMLLALALSREETVWALRGFLVACVVALVLILLQNTVGLPDLQIWRAMVRETGNKSINNALLLATLGVSAAALGLAHLGDARRWHWAGPAFIVTLAMAVVVTLALPSRTSLLAMLVCVFAACVHQWRGSWRAMAGALSIVTLATGLLIWQAPASMQKKVELGLKEIEEAQAGAQSDASWVTRYYMYRDTGQMMLDKPVAGWGIGAWTSEWHRRAPPVLHYKNMPHNDFLWMGSQAGIPGFLSLFVILAGGVWVGWRRADLTGRLGFVGMLTMLIAATVNSAMRDAQIGLSLLWIAFLYLRMVQESGSPWREVLPQRVSGVFLSDDGRPTHPL
ncbi:O-antigen ligase family protein [Variovorax sp. J22R133]|uniref:O-antigen ligase family protein n=1 Tax=Variovorax brevis TaxID=3053503 RepID=UPI002574C501|nr:O-antigen ligase family protein [Variovorax sp. J22R133]MDM0111496.1 O-antigen ligase family protein [Variovorax sp. J22R133]